MKYNFIPVLLMLLLLFFHFVLSVLSAYICVLLTYTNLYKPPYVSAFVCTCLFHKRLLLLLALSMAGCFFVLHTQPLDRYVSRHTLYIHSAHK